MNIKAINAFLIFSTFLSAQIQIRGTVLDSKTERPLSLVNVYESTSKTGTTTDDNGQFELSVPTQKKSIISFTHIAYENQTIPFSLSDTNIVILMRETMLQMNNIVVTSTRNNHLLHEVPIATELISEKEISESSAITISDLLESRAGVSSSVNVDGGSIFNMLGLDSKYILILKNGQPITGRFNNRVDLNHISINNVKKVEITKGPGSALYGTDAMGGIINIITEKTNNEHSIDLSYRASSFAGSPKDIPSEPTNSVLKLNVLSPFKGFTFSNNLTYQRFSQGQDFEYINADNIEKINYDFELKIEKGRHTLSLSNYFFQQNDEGISQLSNGVVLFNNFTDIDRNQFSLTHDLGLGPNFNIKQSLIKSNYKREYIIKNTSGDLERYDITREDNFEYEFLFDYKLTNLILNGGLEIATPTYVSDRITGGKQDKNIYGIFTQSIWEATTNIDVVAGLRLDDYEDTTVVSPRVALSYKPNRNWVYRFSYGHGFRAPSFLETLIDWEHVQFGYTVNGNPNLKPETSRGLTLGGEYTNKTNFQLSALVYHNNFSNLIDDYALESGVLSYRNIEKAYFTGLELITKWTINSTASCQLTLNYIDNKDGDKETIPNTIPLSMSSKISYAPIHQRFLFNISLKGIGSYWPQEYNPATGDYTSVDKKIEAYLLANMNIVINISPDFNLKIGMKNVGDHKNLSYGPYIGRNGYIEINRKIKRK